MSYMVICLICNIEINMIFCLKHDYVYCIHVICLKRFCMIIYPNIHLIYILMIQCHCFNHFFAVQRTIAK